MKLALTKSARTFLMASPLWLVSAAWTQATPRAFDVAAIRPAEFPPPFRAGGGSPQIRAGMQLDSGRLDWGLASLADMVQYAFGVKSYQVVGPDWMRGSRWNVLARLPEGASPNDAPQMMQTLLAERFQLKFHREKRDQPVYALEVAKGGPKLETVAPSKPDATASASSGSAAPGLLPGPFGGLFGRGPGGPPPDAGDGRGGRGPSMTTTIGTNGATARLSPGSGCTMHLELSQLTMQNFADTLAPFVDKPVIDETELQGTYKATLDLPMEVMFSMMQNTMRANGLPGPGQGGFGRPGDGGGRGTGDGGPGGRGPGDGGPGGRGGLQGCDPAEVLANGTDPSNAALFQAVQKLGLRLQVRKAPFDTIVIDRIEKTPTDN